MTVIYLFHSLGSFKRPWNKIKDKYQDLKSKAVSKENRNRTKTGNAPVEAFSKWEKRIIDFLDEKKSATVRGVSGAFDTGADEVHLIFKCLSGYTSQLSNFFCA